MDDISQDYDALYKVLILGNSGVGKSSLLAQYCDGAFLDNWIATIGVDFKIQTYRAKNGHVCKLQLWDTAGQDRFRSIVTSYYRNADGVLLVYDITDRDSFNKIVAWRKDLEEYASKPVRQILVANKSDLESRRVVSTEEGRDLAEQLHMQFVETSSKDNVNVQEAFVKLAEQLSETLPDHPPVTIDGNSNFKLKPKKEGVSVQRSYGSMCCNI